MYSSHSPGFSSTSPQGPNLAGWTRNPAHSRSTYYASGALHLLAHLLVTASLWGGSAHSHFVGKETETQNTNLAQGSRQVCSRDIFNSRSPWLLSPVICFTPRWACVVMQRALPSTAVVKVSQVLGVQGEGFEDRPQEGEARRVGRGNLHQGQPAWVSASALLPTLLPISLL